MFLYKKAEFRKIADDLDLLNDELTDEIICQSHIDELWNRFKDTVHKSMDAYIPSKITSSKLSVLWINLTIKCRIRKNLYPWTFPIWNSLPASTKTAPDVDNFEFIINGNSSQN